MLRLRRIFRKILQVSVRQLQYLRENGGTTRLRLASATVADAAQRRKVVAKFAAKNTQPTAGWLNQGNGCVFFFASLVRPKNGYAPFSRRTAIVDGIVS